MTNMVTAIALAIALPAAAQAAPVAKADKAMAMNCMGKMQGHDMSKMDMKSMDMKGHGMAAMTMPGHDMKMPSCADATQKGASTAPGAHPNHAH